MSSPPVLIGGMALDVQVEGFDLAQASTCYGYLLSVLFLSIGNTSHKRGRSARRHCTWPCQAHERGCSKKYHAVPGLSLEVVLCA